jgi:hypothetical protein
MRISIVVAVLVAAGCTTSSHRAPNLLCAYCEDDSQCGGNPCFSDVSGGKFCGSPCDDCPAGYSCQPLAGTSGKVLYSCFPDSEACINSPVVNPGAPDMAVKQQPPPPPPPPPPSKTGGVPVGGPVGATGGKVDRVFFGFTGDTRPERCGDPYPQQVINSIYNGMKTQGVQFAVDQGDHMFNCGSSQSAFNGAQQQMGLYVSAAALLGKTVFMTMGNHECTGEYSSLCTVNDYGSNANYTAFMDALKPVSSTPYYRVDVTTNTGLAVFIMVADDVWDSAEQSWLTTQLDDADAHAKYTFVSKHHPDGNTDHPEFQTIYDLVRQHKYTLFLTGHSHLYKRQYGDPRAVVMGIGGAPFAGSTNYWGYGTALQGTDDRIYVQVFDQATGNVMDRFDVGPQ